MPYMTSTEVANDLGLSLTQLYRVAGKLEGFFPDRKMQPKKLKDHATSLYVMSKHQLLGRTLELAPGDTIEEKLQSIEEGYQLSYEDRVKLYQSPDTATSLTERLNEIWESFTSSINPAPRYQRKVTELTPDFDGLSPDECRSKAFDLRMMNPESAYMLARRRDEKAALDYVTGWLQTERLQPGDKIHGNRVIDIASAFNPNLGQELRRKGAAWRRFRSNLLGTGLLVEPAKSGRGYLLVPEASKEN